MPWSPASTLSSIFAVLKSLQVHTTGFDSLFGVDQDYRTCLPYAVQGARERAQSNMSVFKVCRDGCVRIQGHRQRSGTRTMKHDGRQHTASADLHSQHRQAQAQRLVSACCQNHSDFGARFIGDVCSTANRRLCGGTATAHLRQPSVTATPRCRNQQQKRADSFCWLCSAHLGPLMGA